MESIHELLAPERLTRVCQFAGKHISPRLIHQGEQISPGRGRGNRKSGGTHISATAASKTLTSLLPF